MMLWLRLSATFHEHPKMLQVRSSAGSRADSAELGWYRLLMAAKRYGRWCFASEAHLAHVAGTYYRFVPIYREAGLLDGLTIHDGESYNAVKTAAERKAEERARAKESRDDVTSERDIPRDTNVTLEEREKETDKETERDERGRDDHDALDVYHELTGYRPWGQWSGESIKSAMNDYTDPVVVVALRSEYAVSGDRKDLLNRTLARLAREADHAKDAAKARPRPKLVKADDAERARVAHGLMNGTISAEELA